MKAKAISANPISPKRNPKRSKIIVSRLILFGDENNGFIFSSDWLKSHDGGYHWIPCEISTPFLVPPDHVYSVMDRQLYKSVNAGSSFVEVNTLEIAPQDWFFVDSLTGWLVNRVGFNYNVLKTEDGGLSWIDKSQTLPENITWENIIIEIPGKLYPDQQVLFIAHFDAIGGQGADDNATGMAALLEILSTFGSYHFANTVKIIFMSGEEKGMIGSGYYADQAKSGNDNILGLINFDAIGYWDNKHPRDLNIIHNDKSEHLADSLISVINTYTNTVVTKGKSYGPQSDHERFWETWPSVWFCEAGNRAEMSPFTNSREDSLNTVNPAFLFENIKASVAAAAAIAQPVKE